MQSTDVGRDVGTPAAEPAVTVTPSADVASAMLDLGYLLRAAEDLRDKTRSRSRRARISLLDCFMELVRQPGQLVSNRFVPSAQLRDFMDDL